MRISVQIPKGINYAFLFLITYCLFTLQATAQLVITSNNNAQTLVNTITGTGITVQNVTFNCPNGASGTFTDNGNIGMPSGIIITSGGATVAQGNNNSASAGVDNGTIQSDPDLTTLEPDAIYDPCILEFDITPYCDTLTLDYVFGSEEYPEFVNAGFNDAFGFFISGPGITGTQNIALVPGTSIPVSIDNVNSGSNTSYYIDNAGGTQVQYDGYTTVLTAFVVVQPCSTYHMKLIIADAGDADYDSGVFLAENGLNCPSAPIIAPNLTSTPQDCSLLGTATASPSNGQTPYTYQWSNSGTTSTITGLSAGTYSITIFDGTNCSSIIDSVTVSLNVPITLTNSQNNMSCNGGNNGTATANASGGITPYSYNWSNGQTTQTATGLIAGTYTVSVTDGTPCTVTTTVTITQPPALSASISSSSNVNCNGGNTGSATVAGSGGVTAYSYQWDANTGSQVTAIANNLSSGSYSVTITDANNCTDTASITITEPAGMSLIISGTNITCNGGNDGSATVTVGGGVTPYAYNWNNGQTTTAANNLTAGMQAVTVTDNNSCTQTASVTINEPAVLNTLVTLTNVDCFANCNGTASAPPTGGTSPYQYLWDDTNNQPTETATGLCAGTYHVTITDANNCTVIDSATITEPPLLVITNLANVPNTCYQSCDGNVIIVPGGGVTPYSYSWSNGLTTQNSATLCAGNYTITITDFNGCIKDTTFTMLEPAQYNITSSSVNSNCGMPDGYASVDNVTGGTSPYFYDWGAYGNMNFATGIIDSTYDVTISDMNNCDTVISVTVGYNPPPTATAAAAPTLCYNSCDGAATVNPVGGTTPGIFSYAWNNGQVTQTAINLCTGSYAVTVTDGNGCEAFTSVFVTQPTLVQLTTVSDTTVCISGTADLSALATGGTGQYTYSWNNGWAGAGLHNATVFSDSCVSVIATDGNGCASAAESVCIYTLPPVITTAIGTGTICEGVSTNILAIATGGDGTPYTYVWYDENGSNIGTSPSMTVFPPALNPDSNIYMVIASDGCSPNDTDYVVIDFFAPPTVAFDPDSTFGCQPFNVTFTNTSDPALDCFWDFGDGSVYDDCGTTFDHLFVDTGTYSVNLTIVTLNGCSYGIDKLGLVVVNPNPIANFVFTPQPTNVQNMNIFFTDLSTISDGNITQWDWTFYDNNVFEMIVGGDTIQHPEYNFATNPDDEFIYYLEDTGYYPVNLLVTSQYNCTDSTTLFVYIGGVYYAHIPNAFTPNGDGINDYFFPKGVGIEPVKEYKLLIFDRWGDLIFDSYRLDDPWDGTARAMGGSSTLQNGVYVWRVEFTDVKGIEHSQMGHVTLLGGEVK
ncbi:MAG: hypothetical protein COA57_13335 [Flavobacteriales bacterium]|nr:MAG: hypothetical protein COA57_13335 [Flavobacteriales bacterium]